ncbi:17-beta-hydroxysteroid dehydrogenase type 2 [Pholidichthys leucotaenia]
MEACVAALSVSLAVWSLAGVLGGLGGLGGAALGLGAGAAAYAAVLRREKRLLPARNRAVLVTGCDSGFGHAVAILLSDLGLQVFAGVLDINGSGAQQLRDRGSTNLRLLELDVTNSSQIEAAQRYIRAEVTDSGLWGLVNNAGVLPCPVDSELQPLSEYRRCLDVNFVAVVNMCQVFLPLIRRARGRVVNMSSMAGEVPLPMFGAYGASKAALSVFTGVMRMELSEWGVGVVLIQPGGFKTNIFGSPDAVSRHRDVLLASVSPEAREDYGEPYISSLPQRLLGMRQQSAEDLSPVVNDVLHALLSPRPRPLYIPGRTGRLLTLLHRCCPTAVFDAIAISTIQKAESQPEGLKRRRSDS